MALKLRKTKEISSYIRKYGVRIEKALILELEYLVAELENHAKLNAGYQDQTSNLKGSIGGAVLKNGVKLSVEGFQSDGDEGNQTGIEFLNSLIDSNSKGYVLILVAGMEYATYVENFHGLNVLKESELKMRRELPRLLKDLKSKIDRLS
jgi:hypothetical protein